MFIQKRGKITIASRQLHTLSPKAGTMMGWPHADTASSFGRRCRHTCRCTGCTTGKIVIQKIWQIRCEAWRPILFPLRRVSLPQGQEARSVCSTEVLVSTFSDIETWLRSDSRMRTGMQTGFQLCSSNGFPSRDRLIDDAIRETECEVCGQWR